MADKKISELDALTGAAVATDDQLVIVDTSAGLTKNITIDEFKNALDTSTGFVRITGDTMTGDLDVQGTVTADGLTVESAENNLVTVSSTDAYANVQFKDSLGSAKIVTTNGTMQLQSGGNTSYVGLANRINIGGNGDISFYEDTGTTAKFFWDASAESLGIGTSSPSSELHLANTSTTITLEDTDNPSTNTISSSFGQLSLRADTGNELANSRIDFKVDGAERMRIDSSGNLLVGTTSDLTDAYIQGGGVGFALRSSDQLAVSRSAGTVAQFNRNTSDGDIVAFRKDGSTVGSITTKAGAIQLCHTSIGVGVSADNLYPTNGSGAASDNTVDIGDSTARFKDLYLSGGVYLGGTGSANKLDDYEEGTWTPAYLSSDGCFSSVTSISGVSGNYTKVGNQVTAWYIFEIDQSITNAEGILRISGLPFSPSFTNYGTGAAQLYVGHGSINSEVASAGLSSTTLYVYRGTVNGTTGTPNIQGFVTYQTNS